VPERLPSAEQTSKALERARTQPLTSPALGTAASDLVESCAVREPRAAQPPLPAQLPPLALAFSGGGFRSRKNALGVLRFLEVSRSARPELEAGREALQTQHVF